LHMLLSQRPDLRRTKSYNLIKICKFVGFENFELPLYDSLYALFLFGYGLSFSFLPFFFFFSFSVFFLSHDIEHVLIFLFFFLHSPYLFSKVIGESHNAHGAFI
jgi:hypothetical protein